MKQIILSAIILLVAVTTRAQVITISEARALGAGATVTVRGIVTTGDEMGVIRYLQDGTAGLAAYPGSGSIAGFSTVVKRGDSIEVTGTLVNFQNLLEISPITSYTVFSSGNPEPAPVEIKLSDLSNDLESQLVSIDCTVFANGGNVFAGSSTYDVTAPDGTTAKVYVRSANSLTGTTIPASPIKLIAVLSQYGDYQLLPRDAADFAPGACFYLTGRLEQSNIQTTGFTVNWNANLSSTAFLEYGTSPALGQWTPSATTGMAHAVQLSSLSPGTIYWLRGNCVHNGDTVKSDIVPFATRSLSSGEIQIYFNHDIDQQFVGSKQPNGINANVCNLAIIEKINNAQQTLDVAMYNNTRDDITDAIKAAHDRGVRVRYVAALNANSTALEPSVPFPVVYGNNIAIMHNKFLVIDADIPEKAWVMSGSMNWSLSNVFNDYNNLLFIQDQSLARTYEIEFEEMWGSDGALPAPLNQRFGNQKKDNTPHRFIIGGIPVENYFSPSDKVTDKIVATVQTADASAEFAMFSFTKNEIADALVEKFNNGISVRGLMENINDSGSEYYYLKDLGIDLGEHYQTYQLHHKYLVIDALLPNSDPTVLTGSHNWSQTAEDQNDENTLVIHDAEIARLFKAEFEKRKTENPVSVKEVPAGRFSLAPNPAWDSFVVKSDQFDLDQDAKVQIWTKTGQMVSEQRFVPGQAISVRSLPDGSYIVKIKGNNAFAALPLQKISR